MTPFLAYILSAPDADGDFLLLGPKGHKRIGNYATLLLGLRVVRGINAISWREAEFSCVFHGVNVFTDAR